MSTTTSPSSSSSSSSPSSAGPLPPELARLPPASDLIPPNKKLHSLLPIDSLRRLASTDVSPTPRRQVPYACLFIDATWRDLACALGVSITAPFMNRRKLEERLEKTLRHKYAPLLNQPSTPSITLPASTSPSTSTSTPASPSASLRTSNTPLHFLLSLSCRTALDLFLTVKRFPPGSHVLMSAINIPDVSVVIQEHALVPIPCDVHLHNLAPDVEQFRKAITPKTVAILVAHIYGRRFDMSPFASLASQHGLTLIEDAAEAWSGFDYLGHPQSELTFFSFGSIKINTAFGGGLAIVRDTRVYEQMVGIQREWPVQSNSEYIKKCIKNGMIMSLLNVPLLSGATMRCAHAMGTDHKAVVVSMLRGFPRDMMRKLRHQMPSAMVWMIRRKMEQFDERLQREGDEMADAMMQLLPAGSVAGGVQADERHHWLFPVCVPYPDRVIQLLNEYGVDAYRVATQLALVKGPQQQVCETPNAAMFMAHVIYLPVHKHVPVLELVRIAQMLKKALDKVQQEHKPRSKL